MERREVIIDDVTMHQPALGDLARSSVVAPQVQHRRTRTRHPWKDRPWRVGAASWPAGSGGGGVRGGGVGIGTRSVFTGEPRESATVLECRTGALALAGICGGSCG